MTTNNKVSVDVIEYSQGQYVVREGEEGECAYILISGEVEVVKTNNTQGKEIVIAILGPNEIFGEMCLFEDDSHRSASVRVISDRAKVMGITRTSFQRQIDELPEGIRNIIRVLIQRLRKAHSRIVLLC